MIGLEPVELFWPSRFPWGRSGSILSPMDVTDCASERGGAYRPRLSGELLKLLEAEIEAVERMSGVRVTLLQLHDALLREALASRQARRQRVD